MSRVYDLGFWVYRSAAQHGRGNGSTYHDGNGKGNSKDKTTASIM